MPTPPNGARAGVADDAVTPFAMRFTFLTAALGVAAASTAFIFYFNSMRCASAAASTDCSALTFASMTNGEKYLLVGLPLTIIVPLLALAWLMGRTPPQRPHPQNSES